MPGKTLNFFKFLVLDIIGTVIIFVIFYSLNTLTAFDIFPIALLAMGAFSFMLLKKLGPKEQE